MADRRLSLRDLREECERRGLSTVGCLERQDLERLLRDAAKAEDDAPLVPPTAASAPAKGSVDQQPARPAVGGQSLAEVQAELDSWVAYAPRALALLSHCGALPMDLATLGRTRVGLTVRRYAKHPDAAVASCAALLIAKWKGLLKAAEARDVKTKPQAKTGPLPATRVRSGRATVVVDDDESSSSSSSDEGGESGEALGNPQDPQAGDEDKGDGKGHVWREEVESGDFRGREERFHVFTLRRPFKCDKWQVQVRIASGGPEPAECQELLARMAADFGAAAAPGLQGVSAEEQPVLQRLQRLEERFRGSGVTEGEARNAMRLFERELSKANWTEERFEKLKRQLAGVEDWSAADAVAEASLRWSAPCRRQAWFSDACERVAMPLGLQFGYAANGGCCFVGPLSAVAGAALTSALVCHLADLDLERARAFKGGSRISAPQFLQGFVDGALERERHLVWERLFAIQDEKEASSFCQEHMRQGFFDAAPRDGEDGGDTEDGEGDMQSLLRNLFSGSGGRSSGGAPASSSSAGRRGGDATGPAAVPRAPESYVPFSGKGQRLAEEEGAGPGAQGQGRGSEGGARDSWALTFASNIDVVRSTRRRSAEQAKAKYHWTFSARAVKATKTGTESYSQGREAGVKRKGEIDGSAQGAKRKFQRGPRLAITR